MLITETLSEDHRHCDDLFAAAEAAVSTDDDAALDQFTAFAAALEKHFNFEESVLFPCFEQASGNTMGPTRVMRSEHTQMRALVEDMRLALQAGQPERFLDLSETLLVMMQQHNLKEEQMLYPMADQALAADGPALLRGFTGT